MADEADETKQQLYRVDVTTPKVVMSLGAPAEDFGYRGYSLLSKEHLFVSVAKNARYQYSGFTTVVGMADWLQYAAKDWRVASTNAMIATGSAIVLSAGGGSSGSHDDDSGWDVDPGEFDPTDHNDMLEPVRYGVRGFDTPFDLAKTKFDADLGYTKRSAALAAEATSAKGLSAKIKALLTGTPPPATTNSRPVDRLWNDEAGGLVGSLQKASRVMKRLQKWAKNPDSLPIVGHAMDKLMALHGAYESVKVAIDACVAIGKAAEHVPHDWEKQKHILDEDVGKARGDGDGGLEDRIESVQKLVTSDWHRQLTVPIRKLNVAILQFTRAAVSFAKDVKSLLLGSTPKPNIGLLAKESIALLAHQRLFAFAPDGFHFVSAPTEDKPQDLSTKLQALADGVEDKLRPTFLGKLIASKAEKAAAIPGFFVSAAGDIRLATNGIKGSIALSAIDSEGQIRIDAGKVAALSARTAVGISARQGTAEVLGKNVALGIGDLTTARKAAKIPIVLAAAKAARDRAKAAYVAAADQAETLRVKYREAQDELVLAFHEQDAAGFAMSLDPILAALTTKNAAMRLQKATLQNTALLEALRSAKLARDALLAPVRATEDVYAALLVSSGVAIDSAVATALEWRPETQALTEKIVAGAMNDVEVFGGDNVKIESTKSIQLKTDGLVPPPASIDITTKVEIAVGPFKITVTSTKVTVNNGVADVLAIDSAGAVLTAGPGMATVTAQGAKLELKAPVVAIDAPLVQIG